MVAVYVGHRGTTFLTLVKQRERSSLTPGTEGERAHAQHSPQVPNTVRLSPGSPYPALNCLTCSVQCLSASVEGKPHEPEHAGHHVLVLQVPGSGGCCKHLLNCTVPVLALGKIWIWGKGARNGAFMHLYMIAANYYV